MRRIFPSSRSPLLHVSTVLLWTWLSAILPLHAATRPKLVWNRIPSTQSPDPNRDKISFTILDPDNGFWQLEMAVHEPQNFVPITPVLRAQDPGREYPIQLDSRARFFRLQSLHPDAALYAKSRQLDDPESIRDLSRWFEGLDFIELRAHVLWMSSLRAAHQFPVTPPGSLDAPPPQLASLVGPPLELKKPPVLDLESWIPGGTNWGTFPNPLEMPYTSNYAVVAVFQSSRSSVECIVGSEGPARGPALMAGGSSTQGPVSSELFFDFTLTGTNSAPEEYLSGRRTYFASNRGIWQMVAAGFTPENIQLQSMIEPVHTSLKSVPQAWNNNPLWTIGARLDGSAALQKRVAFVMILNRQLDPYEIGSVRRLYRQTLGRTIPFAPYSCVFEGDSFTAQALQRTYVQQLNDTPLWATNVYIANVAKGGETIRQMLGQYPLQVEPAASEPGRKILFIWAGANDLLSRSAELIHNDLKKYWAMARSSGFRVVGFTIIPNGGFDGPKETERLLLNERIRESAQKLEMDDLVDVARIPQLQDPQDGRYFLPDRVHLRTEGSRTVADLILTTVPLPPIQTP